MQTYDLSCFVGKQIFGDDDSGSKYICLSTNTKYISVKGRQG